MAAKLENLDPAFYPQAKAFSDAADKLPFKSVNAETDRDYAKQADCFKKKFSRCDGIKTLSLHQARLALDRVVLDEKGNRTWDYRKYAKEYRALADLAKQYGLESGADWYPSEFSDVGLGWDPPHHQFKPNA
jgi:hypothetical protein